MRASAHWMHKDSQFVCHLARPSMVWVSLSRWSAASATFEADNEAQQDLDKSHNSLEQFLVTMDRCVQAG